MKKSVLLLFAAVTLAGCNPQGGTSDQTDTSNAGAGSSVTNNAPRADQNALTNPGAATSQGGLSSGAGSSTATNNPANANSSSPPAKP